VTFFSLSSSQRFFVVVVVEAELFFTLETRSWSLLMVMPPLEFKGFFKNVPCFSTHQRLFSFVLFFVNVNFKKGIVIFIYI